MTQAICKCGLKISVTIGPVIDIPLHEHCDLSGKLIDYREIYIYYPPKKKKRRGFSRKRRERIFERDGNICLKCGTKRNLTIDHITPVSKGGSNQENNLQTLCMKCNVRKGSMTINYRKL